jgi:hypothetical protein
VRGPMRVYRSEQWVTRQAKEAARKVVEQFDEEKRLAAEAATVMFVNPWRFAWLWS